jgi:TonB family protein
MFSPLNTGRSRGRVVSLSASVVLHGLLLTWLLHTPSPKVLAPSFVALGESGGSITHLYWPADIWAARTDVGTLQARKRPAARKPLTWQQLSSRITPAPSEPEPRHVEEQDQTTSSGTPNPAPPAGAPYGTLAGRLSSGDEVRPALPVSATDPVVDPADLPGGAEGSVVVEITIDATGSVTQKTVLQSLGPAIDNKVLAALEYWHFRPATRNGVAVPSKQDVYYHFRPRG